MEQPKVKLELTIAQLNIILLGIRKLPIEIAEETYDLIKKQAEQQLGPPTNTKPPGELSSKIIQ